MLPGSEQIEPEDFDDKTRHGYQVSLGALMDLQAAIAGDDCPPLYDVDAICRMAARRIQELESADGFY